MASRPTFADHLRRTFLTGIFAGVPLAITGYAFWLVNEKTAGISETLFHRRIPFAGVLIIVVGVYLCGLVVNSLLGRVILKLIDRLLLRVPVLKSVYTAWKQIALTPDGSTGIYEKVVLVASAESGHACIGFTSGVPVAPGSTRVPVFVPNAPNPIVGRLLFVEKSELQEVDMSTEDAFKALLSTGNFVPEQLGGGSGPGGKETGS